MKLLIVLFFSLASLTIISQEANERFIITGTVRDADTHTPLQFITVTLQDIVTQEIIGDITTKDGYFEIKTPKGKYYCIVGSLSFKPFIIQTLNVNQDIGLGIIELDQNIVNLDEVELITETKLLDYKFGKKVYNASKDIANIGGNAITVLENTPTVRVDGQGNIYIRGKKAVVLVNGKPYGGLKNNGDILSLIPANSISKVEIIYQSANFDAESGGGILNLLLKKKVNEGYNGTIEVHGGTPGNDGISTFINYKNEKINIFSTASFNHSVIYKDTDINQIFLDENQNTTGNFEELRDDYRQRNSVLFNVGSDFYLDDKNTITTSLLYSTTNKNYDSKLFLNDFKPIDNLVKTSIRHVADNSDESYLETYINYTRKFKKKGHQLTAHLNYNKNTAINNTFILNSETFPANDTYKQKYIKDEYVDNYFLQFDYVYPFDNNAKLELGQKSSFRIYENDFTIGNFNNISQQYEPITAYTDNVNYNEKVYAFYASFSRELKKISYKFGLRTELSYTEIIKDNQQDVFINNYNDLFPSLSLSYNINDDSALMLYYSRNINRPQVFQLNPFNSFTDERFIIIGNPYLRPSYSNLITLEYYSKFEKINLNAALFYNNTTDNILEVLEKTDNQTIDGFDVYQRLPINNGNLNQLGFELILTYFPINKLRLNASVTPFLNSLTNTRENQYDYDDFRWYTQLSANYRFNNTFRMKIDYAYQSALKTAITEFDVYQYTNITASKDLIDGKATLTFKIQDVFNDRIGVYNSLEANTISKRVTVFQTRYLLSFSYRFNKASKRNSYNRSKDIDNNIFEIKDKTN
ncbi:MAG: TonB-dependent receptor family protein [Flavobacteriaceae bacterium]|nr:TonB-dependent receptor family protein [Flavobacteriaceae bacterium]